jgi:peroxidase
MCPQLPLIVEKVVAMKFAFDPTSAKIQLCLFFHDYFMQRCDASILINSSNVNQVEKNVTINFSLPNFFVINNIKEQLEKKCPNVISSINVLASVDVYFVK